MKMFSYLYNVSSKLIGDERYSVLDITKKFFILLKHIVHSILVIHSTYPPHMVVK
jgi:hypothetical protein